LLKWAAWKAEKRGKWESGKWKRRSTEYGKVNATSAGSCLTTSRYHDGDGDGDDVACMPCAGLGGSSSDNKLWTASHPESQSSGIRTPESGEGGDGSGATESQLSKRPLAGCALIAAAGQHVKMKWISINNWPDEVVGLAGMPWKQWPQRSLLQMG